MCPESPACLVRADRCITLPGRTTPPAIQIHPNSLFFNSQYYLEGQFSHYVDGLRAYLKRLLQLLAEDDERHNGPKLLVFPNLTHTEANRRVDSFLQVELAMAVARSQTDTHYDNMYADDRDMTVQELRDSLASSVDWIRYLEAVLPSVRRHTKSLPPRSDIHNLY